MQTPPCSFWDYAQSLPFGQSSHKPAQNQRGEHRAHLWRGEASKNLQPSATPSSPWSNVRNGNHHLRTGHIVRANTLKCTLPSQPMYKRIYLKYKLHLLNHTFRCRNESSKILLLIFGKFNPFLKITHYWKLYSIATCFLKHANNGTHCRLQDDEL